MIIYLKTNNQIKKQLKSRHNILKDTINNILIEAEVIIFLKFKLMMRLKIKYHINNKTKNIRELNKAHSFQEIENKFFEIC